MNVIPDDTPGAGTLLTLRDVREMIEPYTQPAVLLTALGQLVSGKPLVMDGASGFRIAFVSAGTGLYRVYLNENYRPEEEAT